MLRKLWHARRPRCVCVPKTFVYGTGLPGSVVVMWQMQDSAVFSDNATQRAQYRKGTDMAIGWQCGNGHLGARCATHQNCRTTPYY